MSSAVMPMLEHFSGAGALVIGALAVMISSVAAVLVGRYKYRGADYVRAITERVVALREQDRLDGVPKRPAPALRLAAASIDMPAAPTVARKAAGPKAKPRIGVSRQQPSSAFS